MLVLFRVREGHSLLHVVSGTWAASTRLVCAPLVPAPASSLATLPALIMVSPLPQSRTGHCLISAATCCLVPAQWLWSTKVPKYYMLSRISFKLSNTIDST